MTGIQFVTDEKGRKVAVQIDLKKHGARLEDFWDGLISESRRKEKGIPLERVKADLVKRGRMITGISGASGWAIGGSCTSSTMRRSSSGSRALHTGVRCMIDDCGEPRP